MKYLLFATYLEALAANIAAFRLMHQDWSEEKFEANTTKAHCKMMPGINGTELLICAEHIQYFTADEQSRMTDESTITEF